MRSDVERKRLHGLAPDARTASGLDTDLYAPEAGERTYRRLADLARTAIEAGHSVIVDAACLKRGQRAALREAAARSRAPFVILDVRAPEAVLRARISARTREGRDASEADLAVLDHQLATAEPLGPDERSAVVAIDTDRPLDVKRLVEEIERRTGP
jgi:predicted kinase